MDCKEGQDEYDEFMHKLVDIWWAVFILILEMHWIEAAQPVINKSCLFSIRNYNEMLHEEMNLVGKKRFLEEYEGFQLPKSKLRKTLPPVDVLVSYRDEKQGTKRWAIEIREPGIGASEASAVVGVAHYTPRQKLLLRKLGVISEFKWPKLEFFIGHCTENCVRRLLTLIFRVIFQVRDATIKEYGTFVNPEKPSEQMSPDGDVHGGVLKVPAYFRTLAKLLPEGTTADEFVAELKSTLNVDPTSTNNTETDYVIQNGRQVVIFNKQPVIVFVLAGKKNFGILAMLRLPYANQTEVLPGERWCENSRFNGPDCYSVAVKPKERILMRAFLIRNNKEFNEWYDQRFDEFVRKCENQDMFIEEWPKDQIFPLPYCDPIGVFCIGQLQKPIRLYFPGGEAKNYVAITGEGKDEPLVHWIFGDMRLPERFAADEYGIQMFSLSHDEREYLLRDLEQEVKRLDKEEPIPELEQMPPQGIEILETGNVKETKLVPFHNDHAKHFVHQVVPYPLNYTTFRAIDQYNQKAPYGNDAIMSVYEFDELVKFCTDVPEARPMSIMQVDHQGLIYAMWFFDATAILREGLCEEHVKRPTDLYLDWNKSSSQTRQDYLSEHGAMHENLLRLIKWRRALNCNTKNRRVFKAIISDLKPELKALFHKHEIRLEMTDDLSMRYIKMLPETKDKFSQHKVHCLVLKDSEGMLTDTEYRDLIQKEKEWFTNSSYGMQTRENLFLFS